MNLSNKQLVRIAGDICDQLRILRMTRRGQVQQNCSVLAEHLEKLQAVRRKLGICEARRWRTSAGIIIRSIDTVLRDIPYHIQQVEQAVQTCSMKAPALRDIYRELVQAGEEFDGLRYCRNGNLLVVSTEPIELEGVFLGDFEIQLHVPSLTDMRNANIYRIVALDPHPASSNDAVTHPHVSDERLCAGDAWAAITAALAAGRICDFFMLVNSVLTYYNVGSPFVSLENWHGTACYQCGYVTSDVYWCDCCENDVCSECCSSCNRCGEATCTGCLESCPICDLAVCPSCMTTCPECGERLCKTCQEELQCGCIEEQQEEQEQQEQENRENENDSNDTENREGEHQTTETIAAGSENGEGHRDFDVINEVARATASTAGIDAA